MKTGVQSPALRGDVGIAPYDFIYGIAVNLWLGKDHPSGVVFLFWYKNALRFLFHHVFPVGKNIIVFSRKGNELQHRKQPR